MEINEQYLLKAAEVAKYSGCLKAKCGSLIVKDDEIIGTGFNSPAGGEPNRCNDIYEFPTDNKYDVTCCPHAEVRAIHDALIKNPDKLKGATLYFMRVDSDGNTKYAGVPYCTVCSKEALDSGISKFVLWHEEGIKTYDTQEYNNLSYQFFKDKTLWNLK